VTMHQREFCVARVVTDTRRANNNRKQETVCEMDVSVVSRYSKSVNAGFVLSY
jgi:hypothetical protein